MSFDSMSAGSFPVYQACHISGSESVVDIDDRNIGCAAVEHCKQGRQTAERAAIPDTGRHCDDGNADNSSHDARKRALHTGRHDDYASSSQRISYAQQSMNSGNAGVIRGFNIVPHHARGEGRFLRDWDIASSGTDHMYGSLTVDSLVLHYAGCSRVFVIPGLGGDTAQPIVTCTFTSRYKNIAFLWEETAND